MNYNNNFLLYAIQISFADQTTTYSIRVDETCCWNSDCKAAMIESPHSLAHKTQTLTFTISLILPSVFKSPSMTFG